MTPEEFRAALKACGLSQKEFASLLGLALSTVNRWATGKLAPIPRYATAWLEMFERYRDVVHLLPRVQAERRR